LNNEKASQFNSWNYQMSFIIIVQKDYPTLTLAVKKTCHQIPLIFTHLHTISSLQPWQSGKKKPAEAGFFKNSLIY